MKMSAANLSRLLFMAREELDMWADVVEARTGQPATSTRRLIADIDQMRAAEGWSPHGFGSEDDDSAGPSDNATEAGER